MNKIYVVGIGPGAYEQMTVKAVRAIEMSQVIVGYTVYTDLLKKEFPDKDYRNTPMRQEVERCRMAYEEAAAGKKVAMVCSGDAGIYGTGDYSRRHSCAGRGSCIGRSFGT